MLPSEMQPAAMQEHAGEHAEPGEVGRDDAVVLDEDLELPIGQCELVQEDERIQADEADGDDRRRAGRDDIADRKHVLKV